MDTSYIQACIEFHPPGLGGTNSSVVILFSQVVLKVNCLVSFLRIKFPFSFFPHQVAWH